ncbi:MAG: Archaetidylserine synthase [Promethearchaeota archaeon]|nr:MAG: Archaetidylserine synthase [Candidatus Lokiarchaeota archaeon]
MSKITKLLQLKDYITLTGTTLGLIAVMIVTIGGRALISLGFFLLAFTFGTDLLDGYVARKTGTVNEIGKELDSLNDSLTFGIAPAVLSFQAFRMGTIYDYFLIFACAVFALGAILRLARFNISTAKGYTGIPTPLTGLAILAYFYANYFYGVASTEMGGTGEFPFFSHILIIIVMLFLAWSNITIHIVFEKEKDKKVYITFMVFAPLCPIFAILGILNPNSFIATISSICFFVFVFLILGYIIISFMRTQLRTRKRKKSQQDQLNME